MDGCVVILSGGKVLRSGSEGGLVVGERIGIGDIMGGTWTSTRPEISSVALGV